MTTLLQRLHNEKRMKGFVISYFVIGFFGMAFPLTRPFFEMLSGMSILISFAIMMLYHKGWNIGFVAAALFICVAGFAIEVLGVKTGSVFGHYAYHQSFGPRWMETPLLIGINWLMLIYAIYHLMQKININAVIKPVAGALMMVIYDLLLEPVAIEWHMWQWDSNAVPLKNYIAWFVISLIFFTLLQAMKVKYQNRLSNLVLLSQTILFVLLNLLLLL